MAVDDLESEIDALYRADLDDFVTRRNELARGLRREGRRDEADEVKALTKPTISAWAANQLARDERKEVDRLLDAGHRVRESHRAVLQGKDARALERAESAQREAVRNLVKAGRRVLEDRRGTATDSALDRLGGTLRAASVDDDARELLARGRLVADVEPAGFEALGSMSDLLRASAKAREAGTGRDRRDRLDELRAAVERARERERELRAEARRAERAAKEARREAEARERQAEQARRRAEGAAAAVEEAQDRLADAKER